MIDKNIEHESKIALLWGSSDEMANIIYDTLFLNKNYPQFCPSTANDAEIDLGNDSKIRFNYFGHEYEVAFKHLGPVED